MPVFPGTDPVAIRELIKKAWKEFSPQQRSAMQRAGFDPTERGGSSVTSRPSAVATYGGTPRITVGGSAASPATITHEIAHQYLTANYPRSRGFGGMGFQHLVMGIAGDVIEGPNTGTVLVPKALDKAFRQATEALRRGATWRELGGAAFLGGGQRITETRGTFAGLEDVAQWGGAEPPQTIASLVKRPPRPFLPLPPSDYPQGSPHQQTAREGNVALREFAEQTTPQALQQWRRFQRKTQRLGL
jgi:hypothetical protein